MRSINSSLMQIVHKSVKVCTKGAQTKGAQKILSIKTNQLKLVKLPVILPVTSSTGTKHFTVLYYVSIFFSPCEVIM